MPKASIDFHNRKKALLTRMDKQRLPWHRHWRELSELYLPRRYVHLLNDYERRQNSYRSNRILDSTGTIAARTLASGMMNGITSPSRQWFKLRLRGQDPADTDHETRKWLDNVENVLSLIMAESNFYNAMAVLYLDLVIFGTATMLLYEDYKSVIRCYNPALGEYYLGQDNRLAIDMFAREFIYTAHQVEQQWGLEYASPRLKNAMQLGGANVLEDVEICHLIEPNDPRDGLVPEIFPYRELYWEKGGEVGTFLAINGFFEMPGLFARWETVANDAYGTGPSMDAFGDVIQLQAETKTKGQALATLVTPPMLADIQLQNKPTAFIARGITYTNGLATGGQSAGARPAFQINPPLADLTNDIAQVQGRIREVHHNDLFRMIAQLDTVRSATEIEARREEKLVLLGPVLERFENEALDPAINRVFGIAERAGLIPEAPAHVQGNQFDIQYVSILSVAQKAAATAPIERFLQVIGSIAGVEPQAVNIPNWPALLYNYARDIGVPLSGLKSLEEIVQLNAQQNQQAQEQAAVTTGSELAAGAKTLSETQLGGGQTAIDLLAGHQ